MTNDEYRMTKECILSILIKAEQRETILQHSAVQYSIFDSAEPFDPESFDLELTTERLTAEGLVAGCGSLFTRCSFT